MYLPAPQFIQSVAASDPELVLYLPAPHFVQADISSDPVAMLYLPVGQLSQLSIEEALLIEEVEYLPAAHALHVVAPK